MIWGYPNFRKPPHVHAICWANFRAMLRMRSTWIQKPLVSSGSAIFDTPAIMENLIFWIESSKLTQPRKNRTFAQSWICFFDHMFMICYYIRLYQFPKSGNGSTAHLCHHGVHQQFPKKTDQPTFLYHTHLVTRRFNIPIISSGCSSKFVCHVYVRILYITIYD